VPSLNLAGEPRDRLQFEGAFIEDSRCAIVPGLTADELLRRGALVRAAQITGALQRAGELAVQYAQDRVQFGRPIRTFQAVQQHLVTIMSEFASSASVVDLACRLVDASRSAEAAVAAAKVRTSDAVSSAAAAAHQVLGAMGVADEHPLHLTTRRLWSWREEYGNESYWGVRLGRALMADPAALWSVITDCD
jgi:acyl-CoA dehydrogenase